MSAKKRQTMAKMTRERAVKEKRARKQERRDERKAAAEAPDTVAGDEFSAHEVHGESNGGPIE